MTDSTAARTGPVYETRCLTRVFADGDRRVRAVDKVSLDIPEGRFVLVNGRSGSGKTTLLNLLGGLDSPTSGEIVYRGASIAGYSEAERTQWRRREVAFVFQAFALLPGLTARENVDVPLRIASADPAEIGEQVAHYLSLVGLSKRADHRVYELSGGEQQRVAIARALAKRPRIVLADEPTGELDRKTAFKVLMLFRHVIEEEGLTVLATSHDPAVREIADRVYTLLDGRIVETIDAHA
ncbi:MAG: ABC transporter ATP-binding protein [Spirochaetota bacterium]